MQFSTLKKKYKNKFNEYYFAESKYIKYVDKLPIKEDTILLEWEHGKGVQGNVYYILRELSTNERYSSYKIYLNVYKSRIPDVTKFLALNGITNVTLVGNKTKQYFQLVASAKYLITDNTFLPFLIKKEGQILINTWHGTPLKSLGRKMSSDLHSLGNTQKNLFTADYLLFPNEFTYEHIVEDYMLENICKAEVFLGGYPRNEAFFDDTRSAHIRNALDLNDKQVIAYMPTWRGVLGSVDNAREHAYFMYYLFELDKKLNDNQVMFLKLHPIITSQLNYGAFEHIKPFPSEYEVYDLLNAADCLITDYSSVMFDYAITKKPIILFVYDEEDYIRDRGMYLGLDEVPFEKVYTVDDVISAINQPPHHDYTEFLDKFCKYDNKNASKLLCERIFFGDENELKTVEIADNQKENVLIYVGTLSKQGITASVTNLMNLIEDDTRNYILTFTTKKVGLKNKDSLLAFPENVHYIGMKGLINMTIFQKVLTKIYEKEWIGSGLYLAFTKKAQKYEVNRVFGDIKFSNVIQFTGYEYKETLLLSNIDANRIIYVHNDMVEEIKQKGNQHVKNLKYAYREYDKIALVTEDILEPTATLCSNRSKMHVVHNVINYKSIKEKALLPLTFDQDTECNITADALNKILDDRTTKKYLSIGRFSEEKGHTRMINEFSRFWETHQDTYLIIIGGYGVQYPDTLALANTVAAHSNIVIIRSLRNPYSVLNKSDFFVLSSYHEGLPIVIKEADILGKAIVSTNIPGPDKFINEHGGYLVANSDEGVYDGFVKLYNNEIPVMNIDYEKYNQLALQQFNDLLV